nr:hypothetical protein [Angustibacter aerolatus]
MCGRYAATASPDDLVEEARGRRRRDGRRAGTALQPRAHRPGTGRADPRPARGPRRGTHPAACACCAGGWCRRGPRTRRSAGA